MTHRLDLYPAGLEGALGRYDYLPAILPLDQNVIDLLRRPDAADLVDRVNRYLEQLNLRAHSTAIYILDTSGDTVAASNWNEPDSFVGMALSYRPVLHRRASPWQRPVLRDRHDQRPTGLLLRPRHPGQGSTARRRGGQGQPRPGRGDLGARPGSGLCHRCQWRRHPDVGAGMEVQGDGRSARRNTDPAQRHTSVRSCHPGAARFRGAPPAVRQRASGRRG